MTDEKQQAGSSGNSSSRSNSSLIKDIVSGNILTRDLVQTHYRFLLFIVFIGFLYIGNRYHSEYILRETAIVQKELKDAQAESIIISSELLSLKKQTRIIQSVNKHKLGLKPLTKPAKKLVIND